MCVPYGIESAIKKENKHILQGDSQTKETNQCWWTISGV